MANNELNEIVRIDENMYNVCVLGHVFHGIEADNENEAKMIACDMYYEVTGNSAYTDDCVIIETKGGER